MEVIIEFSSASGYVLCLRSKYLPQHTSLWNEFCLCSSPDVGDNFLCTQNDKQNCSYVCFNIFLSIRDSKAQDSGLSGSWHFLKLSCTTETT